MSSAPLSSRYRTALVTGASTGLGREFAAMLVREGVTVWGTARDRARVPDAPGFHGIALDLADLPAAEAAFRAAETAAGGFDLVINNAGFGVFGDFTHTDFAEWKLQFDVMLVATARLSQLALSGMLGRGRGALVNVSSIAGEFGMPYQATYNAVKAGLSALNESLMYEVKGTGVIVVDLRPGDYRTDFEASVRRPTPAGGVSAVTRARMDRVWQSFSTMMRSGPAPVGAAESLRRALQQGRSGTVRTGRFSQAVVAPFLARFGSLRLKRRVQEWYFGL